MKLTGALASLAILVTPRLVMACPGAHGACDGCSGTGGYVVALGIGLLIGMGSVGLEKLFKR
jgi:hypothetical protein